MKSHSDPCESIQAGSAPQQEWKVGSISSIPAGLTHQGPLRAAPLGLDLRIKIPQAVTASQALVLPAPFFTDQKIIPFFHVGESFFPPSLVPPFSPKYPKTYSSVPWRTTTTAPSEVPACLYPEIPNLNLIRINPQEEL